MGVLVLPLLVIGVLALGLSSCSDSSTSKSAGTSKPKREASALLRDVQVCVELADTKQGSVKIAWSFMFISASKRQVRTEVPVDVPTAGDGFACRAPGVSNVIGEVRNASTVLGSFRAVNEPFSRPFVRWCEGRAEECEPGSGQQASLSENESYTFTNLWQGFGLVKAVVTRLPDSDNIEFRVSIQPG